MLIGLSRTFVIIYSVINKKASIMFINNIKLIKMNMDNKNESKLLLVPVVIYTDL